MFISEPIKFPFALVHFVIHSFQPRDWLSVFLDKIKVQDFKQISTQLFPPDSLNGAVKAQIDSGVAESFVPAFASWPCRIHFKEVLLLFLSFPPCRGNICAQPGTWAGEFWAVWGSSLAEQTKHNEHSFTALCAFGLGRIPPSSSHPTGNPGWRAKALMENCNPKCVGWKVK